MNGYMPAKSTSIKVFYKSHTETCIDNEWPRMLLFNTIPTSPCTLVERETERYCCMVSPEHTDVLIRNVLAGAERRAECLLNTHLTTLPWRLRTSVGGQLLTKLGEVVK